MITKNELCNNVRSAYIKFCKGKDAYCHNCPYDGYYHCEILFTIAYLNKRHLIKGMTNEKENNKNK